jgi:hypothetical protein
MDQRGNSKEVEGIFTRDNSVFGKIDFVITGDQHSDAFKIWKELMETHHYLGSGPLFGKRIHYLVKSDRYGWIGGLSFSASAILLRDRDELIGWNAGDRSKNLSKVVSNSRFLIIPGIVSKNLASYILSRCLKRLRRDWFAKYEEELVLVESFVEKARFSGTSYQASNWLHVGSTSGRGRDGKARDPVKPVKDIYLYPLVKSWKDRLNAENKEDTGRKPKNWIEEELGNARFGDTRLKSRLFSIAESFYENPGASINQAVNGDPYAAKAAYRFFENKKATGRRYEIVQSHKQSVAERIRREKVVLAVQDTTSLNYSNLNTTNGLGYIGDAGHNASGLLLHDTLAFTTNGVPLGVLDARVWSRDNRYFGKREERKKLPIEKKESYKWLKSFEAVEKVSNECPDTTIVSVGDREADMYELFELAGKSKTGLLVRAVQNRAPLNEQKKLWDKMTETSVCGLQEIAVPPGKSNKHRRVAKLEVRFSKVELSPPKRFKNKQPISLWAVWATEINAPKGVTPLDWKLLTTCTIGGYKSARKILRWYSKRWGIEVYHRTLKSGCNVEKQYFSEVERIETRLLIYMIIAWRVFYLTKLGRQTPDIPCNVFFDECEWKALNFFFK